MAEMTEEEKYRRKAILLQRALVAADEMDQEDSVQEASVKGVSPNGHPSSRDNSEKPKVQQK